jgi:hypothetical protein
VHPRAYRNAPEALLEVHRNSGLTGEGHLGNLDDVDRSQWPDHGNLEVRVMGHNEPGEPRVVPNHPNQRLTGRSRLEPGGASAGDVSSVGNKHPLNSGGSPSKQRTK